MLPRLTKPILDLPRTPTTLAGVELTPTRLQFLVQLVACFDSDDGEFRGLLDNWKPERGVLEGALGLQKLFIPSKASRTTSQTIGGLQKVGALEITGLPSRDDESPFARNFVLARVKPELVAAVRQLDGFPVWLDATVRFGQMRAIYNAAKSLDQALAQIGRARKDDPLVMLPSMTDRTIAAERDECISRARAICPEAFEGAGS